MECSIETISHRRHMTDYCVLSLIPPPPHHLLLQLQVKAHRVRPFLLPPRSLMQSLRSGRWSGESYTKTLSLLSQQTLLSSCIGTTPSISRTPQADGGHG